MARVTVEDCIKKIPKEALALLEDKEKKNDISKYERGILLNWIGIYYGDGIGVPANQEKQNEYYKKAAELGDSYAMNNIGHSYENGEGVAEDECPPHFDGGIIPEEELTVEHENQDNE